MSLILYPPDEIAFDTNGIGILSDVVDDEVYEELNGQFELAVQYPVDGIHFSEIVNDAYITAKPNPVSAPQPFRIYRITKPMRGVVTIYARHIAYRCKKIVVTPFTALDAPMAMQYLKECAVNDCPFEFWTDKTTAAVMDVKVPTAIWTLLGSSEGSILDTYGGEYEFDGLTVKLWDRRGADRGVSIRYGKNLTDLKMDESVANVCTGVYPYWTDDSGVLVTLPEEFVSGPGTYAEDKIMPLDLSGEFETAPTEDELRARTEQYIADNDIGKPDVTWTIEFVQLEQTEEYKGKAFLEQVLLGDTVTVVFPKMDVDVSARAVAVRYKPTLGRYKNITLGKVKANLASTIVNQQRAIEQVKDPTAQIQEAADRATSWITNGRGYMVAGRGDDGTWYEICSLDTQDINTAKNVWRWNNGGFGFSSNGYQGPYKLALTQDGHIVADFITTGRLASADGLAYFDLDLGFFAIDEPVSEGSTMMQGVRMRDSGLYFMLHDTEDTNLELIFRLFFNEEGTYMVSPIGKPVCIGDANTPVVITGSSIDIQGAPLCIGGKQLQWVTNAGDGYSYLVGVDV